MRKELPFLIYCIEEYRLQKKLSGKAVIELFDRYAVCEYIYEFYDLLHIHGNEYIVNDIDEYIESKNASIERTEYDFTNARKNPYTSRSNS